MKRTVETTDEQISLLKIVFDVVSVKIKIQKASIKAESRCRYFFISALIIFADTSADVITELLDICKQTLKKHCPILLFSKL